MTEFKPGGERPYRRREWFYQWLIARAGDLYTWADIRIQRSRGL